MNIIMYDKWYLLQIVYTLGCEVYSIKSSKHSSSLMFLLWLSNSEYETCLLCRTAHVSNKRVCSEELPMNAIMWSNKNYLWFKVKLLFVTHTHWVP